MWARVQSFAVLTLGSTVLASLKAVGRDLITGVKKAAPQDHLIMTSLRLRLRSVAAWRVGHSVRWPVSKAGCNVVLSAIAAMMPGRGQCDHQLGIDFVNDVGALRPSASASLRSLPQSPGGGSIGDFATRSKVPVFIADGYE